MNDPLSTENAQAASLCAALAPPTSASLPGEVARLLRKPVRWTPTAVSRPILEVGRVIAAEPDGHPSVRLPNDSVQQAAIAASCLLRLQAGDMVSLLLQGERAWVTAVLERDPAVPATLDLGSGALAIHARAITLEADTELKLAAHQLSSHAAVSVSACGDRYANISGTDSTRAHSTLVRTAGHMSLHAGNTSITAEALIKVDAGQVHMG